MAHHAYFLVGDTEEGIERARGFASGILESAPTEKNLDIHILRYGLFSVEDARALAASAYRAPDGNNGKVIIISLTRIFHEAQNALLKIFEEPPIGVTLILVIPSAGLLLPTLRSRLLPLPKDTAHTRHSILPLVEEFLVADSTGKERIVSKLLDRSKSDKDEEKQKARNEVLQFVEGIMLHAHTTRLKTPTTEDLELLALLDDCQYFLPILHELSAPLKLILEHLFLVIPKELRPAKFD
jgi:hypothetical protein